MTQNTYDLATECHPKWNRTNCHALVRISISIRAREMLAYDANSQPPVSIWLTINRFAVVPTIVSTLYAKIPRLPKRYSANGKKNPFLFIARHAKMKIHTNIYDRNAAMFDAHALNMCRQFQCLFVFALMNACVHQLWQFKNFQ